ncbi:MAG: hypothetical protein AAGF12_05250, partial [Myxococcota bacterium]
QAKIPSLQRLNPEVDDEFEALLHRALAQDPSQRFASARDFGDALSGYIFKNQMKVTAYDIAALVKSVRHQTKRPPSQDQSIIDRLIQEELLSFTSIDDMDDPLNPGASPLSPEDVSQGAQPLDGSMFENPADWFTDDADVARAIDDHAHNHDSSAGWQESGLADGPGDLATLLEGDVSRPPSVAPEIDPLADETVVDPLGPMEALNAVEPLPPRPNLPQPAPPPAEPPASIPPRGPAVPADVSTPPAKKSSAWIYIVIVIVLLGGGAAAAWFAGLIPL